MSGSGAFSTTSDGAGTGTGSGAAISSASAPSVRSGGGAAITGAVSRTSSAGIAEAIDVASVRVRVPPPPPPRGGGAAPVAEALFELGEAREQLVEQQERGPPREAARGVISRFERTWPLFTMSSKPRERPVKTAAQHQAIRVGLLRARVTSAKPLLPRGRAGSGACVTASTPSRRRGS